MNQTINGSLGRLVNNDELITDFTFNQAVANTVDTFDFERERMELFGFID